VRLLRGDRRLKSPECLDKAGRAGRWRTASRVVQDHKLAIGRVVHLHSNLATDEERTQVVPYAETTVEIDVAVEPAIGHGAKIEGGSTHITELGPPRVGWRGAVHGDDRIA
jgi:hypothetical protein